MVKAFCNKGQPPPGGHGIPGIHGEVQQGGIEHDGVCAYRRHTRAATGLDIDIGPECPSENFGE